MKADPFVQLRLLDLQALDSALGRLAHRRRTLPELPEITRLEGLVAGTRDDVIQAETAVSDLAREQKKFEDDIESVRARKTRDEDRMSSGSITNSKQLEELQHEVQTLTRRQSALEDAELEVMERAEVAQAVLDQLLTDRTTHHDARDGAVVRRDEAWVDIDAELARTAAERTEVATEIPADLLALYDKIRSAEGGIGAAPIERGRCGGCRLDLMNNEKADYRAAPVDEVLRHDCGRILVRTAESGL